MYKSTFVHSLKKMFKYFYFLLISIKINSVYSIKSQIQIFWNESTLSTMELINHYGFKGESFALTTEDGYHLTLQRIVNEGGFPIILIHGGAGTSKDWFLPLTGSAEHCLAFMLSRAGFDVFLFNSRGNIYSKGHINRKMNERAYWDFSADEISYFDLPTAIDFTVQKTQKHPILLGWSLGGILQLNLLSRRPEYNKRVSLIVSFASAASLSKINPLYRFIVGLIAKPEEPIATLMRIIAPNDHFVSDFLWNFAIPIAKIFLALICGPFKSICDLFYHIFVGYSENSSNIHEMVSYYISTKLDISIRTAIQIMQKLNSDKALFYNYGRIKNRKIYGSPFPPEYNLSKISAPAVFYNGVTDNFISYENAVHTASKMPNVIKLEKFGNISTGWTHIDFVMSYKAPEVLYNPLIKFIKDFLKL